MSDERHKCFVVRVWRTTGHEDHVVYGEALDAGMHAQALVDGQGDVRDAQTVEGPLFLTDTEARAVSDAPTRETGP